MSASLARTTSRVASEPLSRNSAIQRLLERRGAIERGTGPLVFQIHLPSGDVAEVAYAPKSRLIFVLEVVLASRGIALDRYEVSPVDSEKALSEWQLQTTLEKLVQDQILSAQPKVKLQARPEGQNTICSLCERELPRTRLVWQTGEVKLCGPCFVIVQERRTERAFDLGADAANELDDPLLPREIEGRKEVDEVENDGAKKEENDEATQGSESDSDESSEREKSKSDDDEKSEKSGKSEKSSSSQKEKEDSDSKPELEKDSERTKEKESPSEKEQEKSFNEIPTMFIPPPPAKGKTFDDLPEGLLNRCLDVHRFQEADCKAHSHALYYILKTCYPDKFKDVAGPKLKAEKKKDGYYGDDDGAKRDEGEGDGEELLMEEGEEKKDDKKENDKDGKPRGKGGVRYVPPEVIEKGRSLLSQSETKDVRKLYKIEAESGQGGFGSVFMAKDQRRKGHVAIKRLTNEGEKSREVNLGEMGFIALCQHPNIVSLLDAHVRPAQPKKGKAEEAWIILEFLHGGTLKRAASAHRFSDSHVAFVAQEVLKGLSYLHGKGWVHRDIKSANIMLDAKGLIKIIDFGLCTEVEVAGPRRGLAGSRYWLAPEIVLREEHSYPVDVWALAVCLLEMFSGKPPFHPHPVRCLWAPYAQEGKGLLARLPKDATPLCRSFFAHALQVDPNRRATVNALLKHGWLNRKGLDHGIQEVFQAIFFSNALSDMMGYL